MHSSSSAGIIFDFDGVIVLSEPVHVMAWQDLETVYSRPLPEGFADSGTGKPDSLLAKELERLWERHLSWQEILSAKREAYSRRIQQDVALVAGVREALEYFSTRYPLALATSSPRREIDTILGGLGLLSLFQEVLTIESVHYPKPDPEIYRKAAASLKRRPEECWVFEDSPAGLESALGAGAGVIALSTTFPEEYLEGAYTWFPDFQRLGQMGKIVKKKPCELESRDQSTS